MAISLKNFFNQKKAEQTTQLYADFNRLRNRQIELEKQRLSAHRNHQPVPMADTKEADRIYTSLHQLYPLIFEDNKTLGLELEEVWKKSAGNKEAVAELMGRGHEQVPGKPIELWVLIDEAARNLIRQGNLTPIVDLEQRGGYDRLYDDLVSLAAGMYIKETREHKKQREALRNAPTAEAKQAWAQQASKTGAIRGEVASYLTQKRKGGQSY